MKKILILFLVVVAACKDDPAPSIEDLLVRPANGWVRTSVIIAIPNTATDVDITTVPSLYPDCFKDDATVFLSDGTFRIESSVKCSTSEPSPLVGGTWSLSSDGKSLVTVVAGVTSLGDIYELDQDHLKARILVDVDGVSRYGIVTFKPKS
jgi:hypothetical protein